MNVTEEQLPPLDEKLPATIDKQLVKESDFGQKSTTPLSLNHKTTNEKSEPDFDPHDFGQENGIGFFGTTVHLVKITIGSGILMMPYAMKNLGLLNGTILILLVSVLYYHNVHILISTEYYLCRLLKLKRLSFVGVIRRSFDRAPYPINKLKLVVSHLAHLYLSLPTALPTYLIVMSTNIQHMAHFFDVQLKDKIIITVIFIPIMVFTLKRSILTILVPFSSISNIFSIIMILFIIGCSFIYRKTDSSPKIIGDFYFIPKAFAMFMLAVRSTSIILPLKNTMKHPKRFSDTCGSINVAGLSITMVYYTFSLISYVNYEEAVQENILSNLPPNNWMSFVVYLLHTFSLSMCYILSFFACFDNFWSNELESQIKDGLLKTICEPATRIGMNLLIYFFALAVPRISLIAAISGTFGFLIDIALPSFVQMLLQITEKNIRCTTILKDLFIIALSCALFCLSAVRCVREVIQLYAE